MGGSKGLAVRYKPACVLLECLQRRRPGYHTFPWASSRLGTTDQRHMLSWIGTAKAQKDGSSIFTFHVLVIGPRTVPSRYSFHFRVRLSAPQQCDFYFWGGGIFGSQCACTTWFSVAITYKVVFCHFSFWRRPREPLCLTFVPSGGEAGGSRVTMVPCCSFLAASGVSWFVCSCAAGCSDDTEGRCLSSSYPQVE